MMSVRTLKEVFYADPWIPGKGDRRGQSMNFGGSVTPLRNVYA